MASFAGPNLINDNLGFLFDAANTDSYPGSGNTWFDIGPSKFEGTFYNSTNTGGSNGPSFSSDNKGILDFGNNDWIRCDTLAANFFASRTKNFTLQTWVKPAFTADSTRGDVLFSLHAGTGNRFRWQVKSNAIFLSNVNTSGDTNYSHSTLAANEWHFYTFVADNVNNKIHIYLDTELVASPNMNTAFGESDIDRGSIGQEWDNVPSEYLQAPMAMFVGYESAFNISQVRQNYHAFKGRFGL